MKKANIHLGRYFGKARKKHKMTQRQLATQLHLSSSQYISNYERGLCEPSMEHIAKMCDLFEVSRQEIYDIMIERYQAKLHNQLFKKSRRA